MKDKPTKIRIYAQDHRGRRLSIDKVRKWWLIGDKWDLIDCYDDPDLIIIYENSLDPLTAFMEIFKKRKKYGFRCFILVISSESSDFDYKGVDYTISYKNHTNNNYYFPFPVSPEYYRGQFLGHDIPDKRVDKKAGPKTYFCNFIYSRTNDDERFPDTIERESFCKLLSQYKKVDCAGHSLNNTDRLYNMETRATGNYHADDELAKIIFMQDYKFSISFENQSTMGYVTEKIYHAFLAKTIPIYWGSPNIAEFFNPESFINCHDYNSFDEVVERIKEIDNNPELFNQYINAPRILNNSKLHDYTKEKITSQMDVIMDKVINKKKLVSSYRYTRLHELCYFWGFIAFISWRFRYRLFIKIFGKG